MTWTEKIKELYGSQAKFAKEFGVSPMVVTKWKERGVPAERAVEIEEFDKRIPKHITRPDLFEQPIKKQRAIA